MASSEDPRGAIVAAEVAVENGEFDIAEEALHEALSRVRYQIQEGESDV